MRISDWSSDVCSSDLFAIGVVAGGGDHRAYRLFGRRTGRSVRGQAEIAGCALVQCGAAIVEVHAILSFRLHALDAVSVRWFPLHDSQTDRGRQHLCSRSASVLGVRAAASRVVRSEEHTYELQSLMRISYAVF